MFFGSRSPYGVLWSIVNGEGTWKSHFSVYYVIEIGTMDPHQAQFSGTKIGSRRRKRSVDAMDDHDCMV